MKHALLAATFIWLPLHAFADVYGNVDGLIRSGKQVDALALADEHLAGNPRDPRMRLLKGVALAESARVAEAISVFARLTDDYPELPEAHNNLGVLHARQGQLDKARAALETAVRSSTRYAVAYENLGDVHARMAGDAYAMALGIDSNSQRVQPKLTFLRDLHATPGMPAAALSSAPLLGAGGLGPIYASTPAASAAPVVSAPPVPLSTSHREPAIQKQPATEDIQAAVQQWAKAWSSRDIDAYFNAYAADFRPPGLTRPAWEEQRRSRILGKSRIAVNVVGMTVQMNGANAIARFRQDYSADGLAMSDQKTLELAPEGDRWVITREAAGR